MLPRQPRAAVRRATARRRPRCRNSIATRPRSPGTSLIPVRFQARRANARKLGMRTRLGTVAEDVGPAAPATRRLLESPRPNSQHRQVNHRRRHLQVTAPLTAGGFATPPHSALGRRPAAMTASSSAAERNARAPAAFRPGSRHGPRRRPWPSRQRPRRAPAPSSSAWLCRGLSSPAASRKRATRSVGCAPTDSQWRALHVDLDAVPLSFLSIGS